MIDIWDCIKNDTKEKLGFPLRSAEGADDLIRALAKDYGDVRLRAMWAYYISNEREIDFGISVVAFADDRRLAKYAARVTKVKAATGHVPQLTGYICQRDVSINYVAPWCMGEGALECADEMPDCHPDPCLLCKGPMWWVYGSTVARLKEALREHFNKAEAEAVPGVRHADGGGGQQQGEVLRTLSQIATSALQPLVDAPLEEFEDLDLDAEIEFF